MSSGKVLFMTRICTVSFTVSFSNDLSTSTLICSLFVIISFTGGSSITGVIVILGEDINSH